MSALFRLPSSPARAETTEDIAEPAPEGLSDPGLFREMVDNALHGIMVHDQHRPLYVNCAWAALHGLTVTEAMAIPKISDLMHEVDRKRLVQYKDDRLAGLEVPDRYRYRALHKDGRTIWLEHFVRMIAWQGQKAIMATVIDVDDQERQVVALRQQRQSMKQEVQQRSEALIQSNRELHIHQSILDQMSERISVIGMDYRFRMSNQANLDYRRLTREQIIGLHIRDTIGEAHFQSSAKFILDRAFDGETVRSESSEADPDGACRHLQLTTEPFRDPDGTVSGAIVSVRDITAAKEAEEQLRLFASVIEQISDRVSVIGLDYRLRLTNKADANFHQLSRNEMLGRHLAEIVGQERFETFTKAILDRCFKGETVQVQHPDRDRTGNCGTIDIVLEPYRERDGTITGAVAAIRDVTEAQKMSERLAYQARFDQLTGLPNRQAFERLLEKSIADAHASGRTDALCFIDLDQFKIVNDTVGHLAGDRLLQQVAQLFSSMLHENDVLARFGGDEFVLLLRSCSLRRAKRAAEQLITAIASFKFLHEGLMFRVGASIGVTAIGRHAAGAGDVMAQADLACYAAKDNGRNQVQIYKKGDVAIRRRQDEMYRAGGIRAALDDDRFILFGQPIASMQSHGDEPAHLEILVRMVDERRQVIKPNAFIPAAERYGLMAELDRWVIRKAVGELTQPGTSLADTNVSINLSGVTLNDETSLDFIRQTLAASELSSERISFEITETAAIRNMATTEAFMDELHGWGVRFALDDFGSGLSSLKYLKRLPVDFLKIDGSFIRDLPTDADSRAMVKAISQMARDLRIQTVAEGVEGLSTLETLRDLGIDYAQGHAIGIPTPLAPVRAAFGAR